MIAGIDDENLCFRSISMPAKAGVKNRINDVFLKENHGLIYNGLLIHSGQG